MRISEKKHIVLLEHLFLVVLFLHSNLNTCIAFSNPNGIRERSNTFNNYQNKLTKNKFRKLNLNSFHYDYFKRSKYKSNSSLNVHIQPIQEIISTFSKSSSPATVIADVALATPPIAYFTALLSAGIGIPVSEDVLCIIVGTILTKCDSTLRWKLIWTLYAGVVLSDFITFWIGRALRVGVLEPFRKALNLKSNDNDLTDRTEPNVIGNVPRRRKRDRIKAKIDQAGNYIGFVVRLSVGMRGPMMLLTGFTNEVRFSTYVWGTLLGACVSLPIQLGIGYWMSISSESIRANTWISSQIKVMLGGVIGITSLAVLLMTAIRKSNTKKGENTI